MTQDPLSLTDFTNFPVVFFTEFEVYTSFLNVPVDETIHMPPVVYIIHVSFSIIAAILLMNLLVAMMGDTQKRVGQEKEELWRVQVTEISPFSG